MIEPGDKPGGAPPHPFLERLHRAVLGHLTRLGDEEAIHFLISHQHYSLANHPDLPDALRRPLAARRQEVLAQSLLRIWQFQDAADALALDEIPVCPLKGVALLDSLYRDDPEHRAMTDVDLLVPARHIDAAANLLCRRMNLRETSMSTRMRRRSHHRLLVGPQLKLELHSRLWLQYGRGANWAALSPEPATIHQRQAFRLDLPTLLCHLLTHFVTHGPLVSLKWVEDLARLGQLYDGRGALARARRLGAVEPMLAGLRLLRQLLGTDFAPALEARLRGLSRLRLWVNERWVWSYLEGGASVAAGHQTSKLRRNLTALLLAPGWVEAARTVGGKVLELLARASDVTYWREVGRPVEPMADDSRTDDVDGAARP